LISLTYHSEYNGSIRKIAQEKNQNWEAMTEEEKEDFINDLIHEDRLCVG
jgi:hypothetical protein